MNNLKAIDRKGQNGIGLIEVLVATLISAIGLVGLIALQTQTMRATQDTYNKSHAIWIFNDVINRIRANEYYASFYAVGDFQCAEEPAQVCSTLSIDNQRKIPEAALCTPGQQAQFELWEAVCPHSASSDTYFNSSDYLLEPSLSITCVIDGCPRENNKMRVTLSWKTKINNVGTSFLTEEVTP